MKKLLVTGAGGFVGTRVVERYRDKYELIIAPRGMMRTADEDDVRRLVLSEHPDFIAHTAAISDIGTCARDPDASWRANVLLTEWLCRSARDAGAKIVCFSSDQVYTGCHGEGPFAEADAVAPANIYAQHKLESEKRALDILPEAVMLRATWMYDMPLYGASNRGNFLMNLICALTENKQLRLRTDYIQSVTYVRQVAELLEKTFDIPGGAYNYGSENDMCMYDTACAMLRALGLEHRIKDTLVRIDGDSNEVHGLHLSCSKLKSVGICFDTSEKGFERCINDYSLNL